MFFFVFGIIVMFTNPCIIRAEQVDVLIEKLVEKGVLNSSEAEQLAKETRENTASVPAWFEKIDFSGDIRLRHDTQWIEDDSNDYDRNRERFRIRFGFKAKTSNTTEVGVRLASGSGYQNTTNQSCDGHARGKEIFIDRAYASWKPADFIKITGGKHKNLLFTSSLVWDSDVNPEGISECFKFDATNNISIFSNFGQWIIEELSVNDTDRDPTLMVYQIGSVIKPSKNIKIEFGGAFYDFKNLDEIDYDDLGDKEEFQGYNHRHGQQMVFDANEKLLNEFKCFELTAKVKVKKVLPVPFTVFGSYIKNTDADVGDMQSKGLDPGDSSNPADLAAYSGDDRDTGWQLGFSAGNKKKKGDWYAKYFYQELEDYAFPAVFVDSDFHGGGTNNKGHLVQAKYMLADNIQAGATGFFTEREDEDKDGKKDENRVQLDLIIQF